MTGIIITGHGQFATGILSAISLVGGIPDCVAAVDFAEGMSTGELKTFIHQAMAEMEGDDILILADLVGGSPFNVSAVVKQENQDRRIRVLAGVNLPAAVEAVFSRAFASYEDLIPMVLQAGRAGLSDLDGLENTEDTPEFEDGL